LSITSTLPRRYAPASPPSLTISHRLSPSHRDHDLTTLRSRIPRRRYRSRASSARRLVRSPPQAPRCTTCTIRLAGTPRHPANHPPADVPVPPVRVPAADARASLLAAWLTCGPCRRVTGPSSSTWSSPSRPSVAPRRLLLRSCGPRPPTRCAAVARASRAARGVGDSVRKAVTNLGGAGCGGRRLRRCCQHAGDALLLA
jgi:hypothetical protein